MNFLVDPKKITNYNCNKNELELTILFWICAAGKNGVTAARCLNNFLTYWRYKFPYFSPFKIIKYVDKDYDLALQMKRFGIGCYNSKAKSFRNLVNSNIDLRNCTVEDLENIHGIGPKTARCFVLHSRPNQRLACLDTHVLKWLRDQGIDAPKSTPSGRKYKILEQKFLELADKTNKSIADLDLEIWNYYSSSRYVISANK